MYSLSYSYYLALFIAADSAKKALVVVVYHSSFLSLKLPFLSVSLFVGLITFYWEDIFDVGLVAPPI